MSASDPLAELRAKGLSETQIAAMRVVMKTEGSPVYLNPEGYVMSTNIDAPPVADENEAYTLFMHHLRFAASYFEVTEPELLLRLQSDPVFDRSGLANDALRSAALAFVQELEKGYE